MLTVLTVTTVGMVMMIVIEVARPAKDDVAVRQSHGVRIRVTR
jgi:hypothetical protein